MILAKNPKFFGLVLTLLFVAISLLAIFVVQEERQPETGVDAYLADCAAPEAPADSCGSVSAIKTNYGFDLMAEIDRSYNRMQETAKKIANGQLTAAAYQDCLKAKECAAVPMLDQEIDPDSAEARTPENIRISQLFWHLAERDRMTNDVCDLIPLCVMAVDQQIIILRNGMAIEAKP